MTAIFGHRGARGLYPENTIPGFLYAIDLGIDGIELDVVISKDKKVVVSHEPWMNPKICTNTSMVEAGHALSLRRKNLYKMNYADIIQYDCGIKGNTEFPHQKKMPVHKPLLSEVIERVESSIQHLASTIHHSLYYLIEIKSKRITEGRFHPSPEEFVELVIKELLPFNINNRIIIQSFDMRPLNIVHKFNSGFTTYDLPLTTPFKIGMLVRSPRFIDRRMKSLPFTPYTCGIYYKFATKAWIRRIQKKGMKALVWTVNEEEDIKNFLSLGADGIITDYPALGLELRANTP